MKKIILICCSLLSITSYAFGACSWSDNTGTAASASVTDISACVSDASGKTGAVIINIPNDSKTWTGDLTIDMSSGFANVTGLSLIGAGSIPTGTTTGAASSGGTTITLSSTKLNVVGEAAKKIRIANITFTGTADTDQGAIYITGLSKLSSGGGWRVDHISFNNAPTRALSTRGYTYGVVDHCFRSGAGQVFNVMEGVSTPGNVSWGRTLNLGDSDAVYFEDNDVQCTGACNSPIMFADGASGARMVIRYNVIQNHYLGGHDPSSLNRGIMQIESYNNAITLSNTYGSGSHSLRGGTGVHFNNYIESTHTANETFAAAEQPYGLSMTNYRSDSCNSTSGLWANKCNADGSALKGFLGADATYSDSTCTSGTGCEYIDDLYGDGKGWPCRDQIGRGTLQTSVPMLFWTNYAKFSTAAQVIASPHVYSCASTDIQANRDYYAYTSSFNGTTGIGCGTIENLPGTCTTGTYYWATTQSCSDLTGLTGVGATASSGTLYKCTAKDTWTASYAPYTYPHPLRDDAPADETAPTASTPSIDATGLLFTIPFSESVDATTKTGITLTCTGGAVGNTYKSGAGSATWVYDLDRALNQGETCTWAYATPGTGIKDLAANALANFTGAAVTNGSTVQSATTYELSMTVVGGGTINSSQGGIQCTAATSPCTKTCDSGTVLTFTAIAFNGWLGTPTYSGSGCSATTTMSEARTCTATFTSIKIMPW